MGSTPYRGVHVPIGFLVDSEVMAHVVLTRQQKDDTVPEDIKHMLTSGHFDERAKIGNLNHPYDDTELVKKYLYNETREIENFDGTVHPLFPERCENTKWKENMEDSYILYIPAKCQVSPFHQAYRAGREIYSEFHDFLCIDCQIVFPPSFDMWAHIVTITGIYIPKEK